MKNAGKMYFGSLAALCVVFAGLGLAGSSTATAQDQAGATVPPPNMLFVGVEFPKQGLAPDALEKAESPYVQAFANAKFPEYYLAMTAISGHPRTVFFYGYDSFAAAQKIHEDMVKDSSLMAALKSADANESQMLKSSYTGAFVYRPELSLRAPVDLSQTRFMEIMIFNIRPGHQQDFVATSKMYVKAWSKDPDAHWAAFEKWYGDDSGGRYIVVTPMKSLADVDREVAFDKQSSSSMSAEDQKKMSDLFASSVKSYETNLFVFNPKMSYVPDNWKTASPDFWGKK